MMKLHSKKPNDYMVAKEAKNIPSKEGNEELYKAKASEYSSKYTEIMYVYIMSTFQILS